MGKLALHIPVLFASSVLTKAICFLIAFIIFISSASAQPETPVSGLDSILNKLDPQQWSVAIEKKVSRLEEKMIAKSEKALRKLQKEEEKIYKKLLTTKDSLAAKTQLEEIRTRYAALQQKLKNPSSFVSAANVKDYVPWLDSAGTALKFLDQQGVGGNIKEALSKVESFNGRLQQADEIKRFIRERKEQLRQQLETLGLVKELKKFNKEIFYYAQTIREYKEILKDPKQIERKAIELLSKTKMFQDFMRRNSLLASLFRMPGDPNDPNYTASLAGLQTRNQVNSLIQNQIAAGGSNAQQAFQQNIQQAQQQLQQLKDKVNQWGGGGSDDIMPEGFKPNPARSKTFLQRITLGTDFQTTKHNNLFPVGSDVGVSASYMLNARSHLSVGTSMKIGWGSGFNHIRISAQGVSIRGGLDWRLKGNLFIAGKYEQNYFSEIRNINQLRDYSSWKTAGMLGLSKKFTTKKNKGGSVSLLYDFFYNRPPVRTQPVLFRISYDIIK